MLEMELTSDSIWSSPADWRLVSATRASVESWQRVFHPNPPWDQPAPSPYTCPSSSFSKDRMPGCPPLCWGGIGAQQYGRCVGWYPRHPVHRRSASATTTLPQRDGRAPQHRRWAKTLTPPRRSTTTASSPTTTMWLKVRRRQRTTPVSRRGATLPCLNVGACVCVVCVHAWTHLSLAIQALCSSVIFKAPSADQCSYRVSDRAT